MTRRLSAAGCVYPEDEARLLTTAAADSGDPLEDLVVRREAGEPLEHIVGWADFCGHRIRLAPGVFVPRRRTEWVVAQALEVTGSGAVVVDLCCGSGAIGVALVARVPWIELYAVDLDPVAVSSARINLTEHRARVLTGDLYEPLPAAVLGRVDTLTVNAPYVPTDELHLMPPEARDHEPSYTLVGGVDGLDVHRRVVADAPAWLAPGGHLVAECGRRQASDLARAMSATGLEPRILRSPDLDATVVVGRRPPS